MIDEAFDGWVAPKNGNSNDYAKWFNKEIESDNEIMGAADNMTWAQFDLTAMIERGQNDRRLLCGRSVTRCGKEQADIVLLIRLLRTIL